MNILVVGSGAREHVLVWKIAQSAKGDGIYCAPGNAGTGKIGQNMAISQTDIPALVKAARVNKIDLVVVGPEDSLALGIVDQMQCAGIAAFGPTQSAARIETSKIFAKDLMTKYKIQNSPGATFDYYADAKNYVQTLSAPPVIKADGLAAGKGVVVCKTIEEALETLYKFMVERSLKDAGKRVIVEDRVYGNEVSAMCFTDGKTVIPLVSACDYKRAYDGDKGSNTGGMGSYSPSAFITKDFFKDTANRILSSAVKAMMREGRPYQGVLNGGLILTDRGLKVLEFNARFGDPETQVQLPLLRSDLVDIMTAVVNGTLGDVSVEWSDESCVGVVMASEGYPGDYKKSLGASISGLDDIDKDVLVFHAGTKKLSDSTIVTNGGRVLTVVATGKTPEKARFKAYDNVRRISFKGCHFRTDIAEHWFSDFKTSIRGKG